MLHNLLGALPRIEAAGLGEHEVYGRTALYRRPTHHVRPGVLECPICGARAQRFLPFGLARRPNAECPRCGSLERHRFLWLYLARATNLLTGRHSVLHTAPEPCLEAMLRGRPNLAYRTVDRYNPAADLRADLTDLPLAQGSVGVVLSSHVLEHVPDDERAMAELARVLRRGGWAVVMVPFDPGRPRTEEGREVTSPAERMARFGHPYHYRIYGADVVERLEGAGFAVRTVGAKRLLTPHQRRRFRIGGAVLFHCRRR